MTTSIGFIEARRDLTSVLSGMGTIALIWDPRVELFGSTYRLFDVAGIVATAVLGITVLVSVVRNKRALYRAEPLPSVRDRQR